MVESVINNLAFLKALVRASRYKRRSLLSLAKTKQLLCLKEICRNLNNNIPMSNEVYEKLTKGGYKPYIRLCGDKNTNLHTTRSTLVKRGGFIPLVIPAAIRFAQNYMMTAPYKRHRLFKQSDQRQSTNMNQDDDFESSDTQSNMDTEEVDEESSRDSSDNYNEESNMDTGEDDDSDENSSAIWKKLEKTGRKSTTKKNHAICGN